MWARPQRGVDDDEANDADADSSSVFGDDTDGNDWDDDWKAPWPPQLPSCLSPTPVPSLLLPPESTKHLLPHSSTRAPPSSSSSSSAARFKQPSSSTASLSLPSKSSGSHRRYETSSFPRLEPRTSHASLRHRRSPPPTVKAHTDVAKTNTNHHLITLRASGVRHIPAIEVRAASSILAGSYVESIVHGDHKVLAGESALSSSGGRPASATRAIASNPARYGAGESILTAMALAHAHCTLHDLFRCDTRLASDKEYYDILSNFVTSLTDWPAVATPSDNVQDNGRSFLYKPSTPLSAGFSLGLRCDAVKVVRRNDVREGAAAVGGVDLVQHMMTEGVAWRVDGESASEGWFPWLFVEPRGVGGDDGEAYVQLLSAMRTSLTLYSRLHNRAQHTRPARCPQRSNSTRVAYGLSTRGVAWQVFAMAEENGLFPVTVIWSGRVEEPRHMAQATAILRQIGAEARPRLNLVNECLGCICGVDIGLAEMSEAYAATYGPSLPPGIPIPGITHPADRTLLSVPPSRNAPGPIARPAAQSKRSASPTPSLKPWVEPFTPVRPASTEPKMGASSRSSPTSSSSGNASCSAGNGAQSDEQYWKPAPYPAHASWEPWRGNGAQHSPDVFNYSSMYEYAWPLPGASAPNNNTGGLFVPVPSWNGGASFSPGVALPIKRVVASTPLTIKKPSSPAKSARSISPVRPGAAIGPSRIVSGPDPYSLSPDNCDIAPAPAALAA